MYNPEKQNIDYVEEKTGLALETRLENMCFP